MDTEDRIDEMTARLADYTLVALQKKYTNEFKKRLKRCGANGEAVRRIYEYTQGIYKKSFDRLDFWGYDYRPRGIDRWVFKPGTKIFPKPLLEMVENDELTFSEVMMIYDEAQWHYQNSRDRDFIPEAWEEVEEASGHRQKVGEKFYLDREIEKLAELGMTMKQAQRLMEKEQDLLFLYKWKQKIEYPYESTVIIAVATILFCTVGIPLYILLTILISPFFIGLFGIFLVLIGAVLTTELFYFIYLVRTVGAGEPMAAVVFSLLLGLGLTVFGIFLVKQGIKIIKNTIRSGKEMKQGKEKTKKKIKEKIKEKKWKQEGLGEWREPVQESTEQREAKDPRSRAIWPYEILNPQGKGMSLWEQEKEFIEILFKVENEDRQMYLYGGAFGIDTRSGIPYYIDLETIRTKDGVSHTRYYIKERVSWHELRTFAEKLRGYSEKYFKNINEDNWQQTILSVHAEED